MSYVLSILCISFHIFTCISHLPLQMYIPTRGRTSWPLTVAGLSIMISPVKCDPAAWSCTQQSAMATGSFKSALTNGPGWQWISRLQGCLTYHSTNRHYYSHWVCLWAPVLSQSSHSLILYYCVSLFRFLLITCNSKLKSKMLCRHGSSKINNTAKRCELFKKVPKGG